MKLYRLLRRDFAALQAIQAFRGDPANATTDTAAAEIEAELRRLNGELGSLFRIVERADVGPTSQAVAAAGAAERALEAAVERWEALRGR